MFTLSDFQGYKPKLEYDPNDPLTFFVNILGRGGIQVNDLPQKEQDEFVQEFQEKERRFSDQSPEFTFRSRKIVESLEEMTILEQRQWMVYLRYVNANILERFVESEEIVDFFDSEFEEDDGWNDEIWIDTWTWQPPGGEPYTLTDIYAWPGDNQHGAVLVGMDLIFDNSDMHLSPPHDKFKWMSFIKRLIKPEDFYHPHPDYPHLYERAQTLTRLKDRRSWED